MDHERPERVIHVDNETHSSTTRTTVQGKRITYQLEVIQQPLRARACGAGAKSSADRRPVDPPPIVELKIYSGNVAPENDITFAMEANYFLFATLEQARPIAHGRVPEDKSCLTVLTGTPVAGMVYLERPTPAGYFIFPDLSVRHEGKYRLSFSLYEELKQAKDFDEAEGSSKSAGASDAHVTHRLEVKSVPFTVFSAKRFPGLTESTSLSRMVAEQGCRVRIRRDVRMRKRDQKPGKDWDDYEAGTAQAHSRLSATPESSQYAHNVGSRDFSDASGRPRSSSNATVHSLAAISRRPSLQDASQTYQGSYHTGEQAPRDAYGPLTSPAQPLHQSPYTQHQQQTMQPPPYQQAASYGPSSMPSAPPAWHCVYPTARAAPPPAPLERRPQFPPHPSHPVDMSQAHRSSIDYGNQYLQHDGRATMQYPPTHHQHTAFYQTPPQPSSQPTPPPSVRNSYPSIQPSFPLQEYSRHTSVQRTPRMNPSLPGRAASEIILPPLQMPDSSSSKLDPTSPALSMHSATYFPSTTDTHPKRSYSSVFNERHLQQPLRDGARPALPPARDVSLGSSGQYANNDDGLPDYDPTVALRNRMDYRRADGSQAARCLPQSY